MFYDIIQKEVVDENGNITIEFEPQTVAPVYDDIAPSDMSLENQLKAGINMQLETGKVPDRLSTADRVGSSVVQQGNQVLNAVETSQQLSKKQQQQQQQQQSEQQQSNN